MLFEILVARKKKRVFRKVSAVALLAAVHAKNWQLGFPLPATAIMEGIIRFHHDLFTIMMGIVSFVLYMLIKCLMRFNSDVNKTPIVVTHEPDLEIAWTIIPALILIFIALPSFSLLYSMDEIIMPILTIKIIGHQWYWSYEYMDSNFLFDNVLNVKKKKYIKTDDNLIFSFDSYMLSRRKLRNKKDRLLAVDNKLYIPAYNNLRFLITSSDVLHSWAVPQLGIKLDACPGRLNQTSVYVRHPGFYRGQCSEICGIKHGFMPINVVSLFLTPYYAFDYGNTRAELFSNLLSFFVKKQVKN